MRRLNSISLFPMLLAFALVGYLLPWLSTPANSLSLGAYDLAEWSSLHPVVRQTAPFLWTALALRIPLAVLGILLGAYVSKTLHQTPVAIICLFIATITLLPPLEFFTTYRDDPNYRQQFILSIFTVIIGILTTVRQPKRLRIVILAALSLLGALSATIGLYQAQNLMQGFHLPVAIGTGGVIMSVTLVAVAFLHVINNKTE